MNIDWNVVATIAAPIIALFIGAWVNRRFENRASLTSYFGHVSSFVAHPTTGPEITIFTHTVVLRNAGRRSATNVRVHHKTLPDFNIWPSIVYHIDSLPDGTKDIVIPNLVPSEQITISYLYFPPLTVDRINAGIKYDQGFANQIPVLLQRQYPKWFNLLVAFIMLIGLIAIVYCLYLLAKIILSAI